MAVYRIYPMLYDSTVDFKKRKMEAIGELHANTFIYKIICRNITFTINTFSLKKGNVIVNISIQIIVTILF